MKKMKKLFALLIAAVMVLAMNTAAFAADDAETSTPSITIKATSGQTEAQTDTTVYTWYRILEASIEEDPKQSGSAQSKGKVSYYVTTQERADELTKTGLFNVLRVADTDKWFVELKDENTDAEAIADAFAAATFNLSKFETGSFAQTAVGGAATSGTVNAGYYYITSTAGTKVVIQTLRAVTIDEKNTFPTVEKAIAEDDKNAQIGDDINYTLTVKVPQTANDKIVLTDTMDKGLTFKSIDSATADNTIVAYQLSPETVGSASSFTITFSAETVRENQGKTIVIQYTAHLNKEAGIETGIKNRVKLDYGIHYTSVEKAVETKTYKFEFDKVDGADKTTKLTGAEFELRLNGAAVSLVEVEKGKTYRIATSDEEVTTTKITTNGNTVTINGLDSDSTYSLVETKEPTGYNKLSESIEVKAETVTTGEGENASSAPAFVHKDVENNKGSVLPSTGGMGTTIFYIVGAVLVIGAGVILVTRRRMNEK